MRLRCSRCGVALSTEVPEGTLVRAWIECPECIMKEDIWEKEFEGKLDFDCIDYFGVENKELGHIVWDFIGGWETKVKVKCKDGCIQIERVKCK